MNSCSPYGQHFILSGKDSDHFAGIIFLPLFSLLLPFVTWYTSFCVSLCEHVCGQAWTDKSCYVKNLFSIFCSPSGRCLIFFSFCANFHLLGLNKFDCFEVICKLIFFCIKTNFWERECVQWVGCLLCQWLTLLMPHLFIGFQGPFKKWSLSTEK